MKSTDLYPKALAIVILICMVSTMVSLFGCQGQLVKNKELYIVFRFDDYSAKSSTDIELKIIDAFRKHGASITFGVIPFISAGDMLDSSPNDTVPLTPVKGDILRAALNDGTVDIALHGYSHQTTGAKKSTEFKGLDFNSQLVKLAKGKSFLEGMIGVPVTTFVPPWNSYDSNTLRALEQLGFSTISADQIGEATEDSKLGFLPASSSLARLQDAVEAARISSDAQPVIVVLFHEYDFKEINEKHGSITYRDFSELLNWIKSQEDARLLSISQAAKLIEDLTANRFELNKQNYLLSRLLPPPLREKESNLYLKHPVLLTSLVRVGAFYLVFFSLWAACFCAIGYLILRRSASIMIAITLGSVALSIGLLIYAFHDLQVRRTDMMVSVGAVGICVGLCLSFLYFKKKRTNSGTTDFP